MPYVEVDKGVRYYYEDRGQGKPIVFVHGWGMSNLVWEGQAVSLSDQYRVISLDCRGCGKSDKPKDGYSIAELGVPMKEWFFSIFMQHSWFTDETLADLGRIDFRDKLGSIRTPVAFFHGVHDQVVPYVLSEYSAKQVPSWKLVAFENSAHTPFIEEPQRFNEELLAFIQS